MLIMFGFGASGDFSRVVAKLTPLRIMKVLNNKI
jgi:hypothetical protein